MCRLRFKKDEMLFIDSSDKFLCYPIRSGVKGRLVLEVNSYILKYLLGILHSSQKDRRTSDSSCRWFSPLSTSLDNSSCFSVV